MKALSGVTYAALRKRVEEALLLGQRKIEAAKVRTYWETGRLINEYLRKSENPNQEHGKKVVARLAKDLGFGEKVLYRAMRFAEVFPTFSARRKLSWAHYRALFAVSDEKKRLALADQASKGEWSCRDLEIEVRNLLWDKRVEALNGKTPSLLPEPVLGSFYTYRIIAPETVHSSSKQLLLDLGFSCRLEMEIFPSAKFSTGTIVASAKDTRGQYSLLEFRPQTTDRSPQNKAVKAMDRGPSTMDSLYTYKAFVQKIVDGDTLHVEFRLGFGQLREETLRLKGIDCPELDTPEGQAAKRFVERELAHCDFITVKSTQTRKEKWGRYLGDIFYENKEGRLTYLNNLLLEKGHAVRVRE